MGICVRPVEIAGVAGFRECVDAVMREREYLAYLEAFSLEQTAAFITTNLDRGNPHFVAAAAGRIVGWCDIRRETIPVYSHCALLGLGVLKEYRGRGIGERLMCAALDQAKTGGFERVELSVYAKNTRAASLYRRIGFVHEGTRLKGKKLDGVYDDVHMMVFPIWGYDNAIPAPG